MSFRVAVVGCGLIGCRRAAVAREAGSEVVIVVDGEAGRAGQVAAALSHAGAVRTIITRVG